MHLELKNHEQLIKKLCYDSVPVVKKHLHQVIKKHVLNKTRTYVEQYNTHAFSYKIRKLVCR